MAALLLWTIFSQVESKVTIHRNTPTAAVLSNLYDFIKETFQDADLYYSQDELQKLKENENTIFLERGSKDGT